LVALVEKSVRARQGRHFTGLPPELTGDVDNRQKLPPALVLIIEEKADGIFLFRFTEDRAFAGDTWHQTIDEAIDQAIHEYGELHWKKVPEEIGDPISFALMMTDNN